MTLVPVQPIIEEVEDAAPPLPVVQWQELGPLEVFIPFRENGQIERAPRPSQRTTHYTVTIVDARDADENRRRTEALRSNNNKKCSHICNADCTATSTY